MSNTVLYSMMLSFGLLMAVVPFGIFMGLGTMTGLASDDWQLWVGFLCAVLLLTFLVSMAAFALLQKSECGTIKGGAVMRNAGISTAIQGGFMAIIHLIPWFRNVVKNLMPPDLDDTIRDSVGYAYYTFWGTVYGIAVGGNLSRICT